MNVMTAISEVIYRLLLVVMLTYTCYTVHEIRTDVLYQEQAINAIIENLARMESK